MKVLERKQIEVLAGNIINCITASYNASADPDSKPLTAGDIVLGRNEMYDSTQTRIWAFRNRGDYRFDTGRKFLLDVGNMVNTPLELGGVSFHNSECAYIAGLYSNDNAESSNVQQMLVNHRNGLWAKKTFRYKDTYKAFQRTDWQEFNVAFMNYVIACKVNTNTSFRDLLLSLPDNVMLVEDVSFQSSTSLTKCFWGSENQELTAMKKQALKELRKELETAKVPFRKEYVRRLYNGIYNFGMYSGVNTMGKILTYHAICLRAGVEPAIDFDLLESKEIYLCGKRLELR